MSRRHSMPPPNVPLGTTSAPVGVANKVDVSDLAPGEHIELDAIDQTSLPDNEVVESPDMEPEVKIVVTPKVSGPITVIALRAGFIHRERKVEGDIFVIKDESEFSKAWMKKI